MIPLNKVKDLISRHVSLEAELSSGKIDKKKFAEKSKEYSDLNNIVKEAKAYSNYENEKKELDKIISDKNSDSEMKELAELELKKLTKDKEINEKKIRLFLLPKDEADKKNAIIEIRAGTGGLEASLFASDLFKMYEKICHKKNGYLKLLVFLKVTQVVLKR